jgi:hypothetical protein
MGKPLSRADLRKMQHICGLIATDMKDDSVRFEGQPFTGKTVAAYLGNLGAAVASLANMLHQLIEDDIAR